MEVLFALGSAIYLGGKLSGPFCNVKTTFHQRTEFANMPRILAFNR